MKILFLKYKFSIIGGFVGAVGGYLYYLHYSCASGTCLISSSPTISTLYGSMMGVLLISSFSDTKKNEK